MGHIFSRPLSLRDILLHLESCISTQEEYLHTLSVSKSRYSYILIKIIIVCYIPCVLLCITYSNIINITIIYSMVSMVLLIILRYYYNYRINRNILLLENYKKTQKEKIELFKKQEFYVETKNIIDKYESKDNKHRNISKTKKSSHINSFIDKVADVVLKNDPSSMHALICSQCKTHNGLVSVTDDFKCKECNHYNKKLSIKQQEDKNINN